MVSPGHDGTYIQDSSRNGVFVDGAGDDGVQISDVDGNSIAVHSPADDGALISRAGDTGVNIPDAGRNGLLITRPGEDGVQVTDASDNGMSILNPGGVGVDIQDSNDDGVSVSRPGGHGVAIFAADRDGVRISYTREAGFRVDSTRTHGFLVEDAGFDGLQVGDAGDDGVHVFGADDMAGVFDGDVQVTDSCNGCAIAAFGRNVDPSELEPGDVVAVRGIRETVLRGVPALMDLVRASAPDAVVGVVAGRVELDREKVGDKQIQSLVPREGPAQPGEYVNVIIDGLAQVKVSAAAGIIKRGARLTAADRAEHARAQRTVEVDGISVAESAPVLGVALEGLEAGENLIWVLVNPR